MGMSKMVSEVLDAIGQDWEYGGVSKGARMVFKHKETGAIIRTGCSTNTCGKHIMHARRDARRVLQRGEPQANRTKSLEASTH